MPKRKSYTADFKLTVIDYADIHGNRSAGREFSVDEKSVREWRKEKGVLERINPRKRARRGPKARWPNLESDLKEWVLAQRENNRPVSTVAIKLKAKLMAREKQIVDFKGGVHWVYKFMKRNQLSVRARTTVGQHLPENWEKTIQNFHEFVTKEIRELDLSPASIINMDEVPMSFDIPSTRCVAETGSKTVKIATTGHERTFFTVVLACSAAGDKLKPMAIFKRVTIPREKLPAGIVVECNRKGWMNCEVMKIWLDKCYRARPGGFFKAKSLLIMDAMAAHKETEVQAAVNRTGAHIAIIPGGLTCKLQPLDIAVNHSFKIHVRAEWENWMANGQHSFTPAGRQRRATYVEVCKWIITAWSKIKPETIRNGFAKAEILAKTDGAASSSGNSNSSDDDEDEDEHVTDLRLENALAILNEDSDIDDNFEGFISSSSEEDDPN